MTDENRVTLEEHKQALASAGEKARAELTETHDAREQALRLAREVIRNSANSIRATHRGEFADARQRLAVVRDLAGEMKQLLVNHPPVYYAGFVEDAQKEYAEASSTLAFAEGSRLPTSEELGVGPAAYMNGLAEAVGELRRFVLDSLRRDDFSRCEDLLELMDDVYTLLVSIDFPDSITRGLRRNTDMVRGVLERTRGDLTIALRQRRLEQQLAGLEEAVTNRAPGK